MRTPIGARLGAWIAIQLTTAMMFAQTLRQTLRVVSIPAKPLPVVVAQARGLFRKRGIEVQVEVARDSNELRRALAGRKADIAHAAADNAVAMVEGGSDVIIVMGGEASLNELIAQPGIRSISGLRDKTLIVDAPNTGYALELKKILLSHGLQPGRDFELKAAGPTPRRLEAMREHREYAASILGPPTSLIAKHEGFVSLGSTQEGMGGYQTIVAFVGRQWAREGSDQLADYLAAYIEAQRWLLTPANKNPVIQLLRKEWHLSKLLASQSYALMNHGWYEQDAHLDLDGFRNVLKLRAEVEEQWGGKPPAPNKYLDMSYYGQALRKVKSSD